MKNKQIIKKVLASLGTASLFFLCSVMMITTTSCVKDKGDDATPVVKFVRPVDAAQSDALLTSADMGAVIAIIGEHLSSVTEVWFNDKQAKLNPVYITSTSIIVTVPSAMPTEITNNLTLKTKFGKESVTSFAVNIPVPKVTSISNEFAADGATVKIFGDFFFADADGHLVEILFPGNVSATITDFDITSITCIVPNGSLPGTITVESIYGKGRAAFLFRNTDGIFCDAETPSDWNWWGYSGFSSDGGQTGQYINITGTTGSWAWPANSMILYYFNDGNPIITVDNIDDYALSFEYKSEGWAQPKMMMWFTGSNDPNVDGTSNCMYYWEPYIVNGSATNLVCGWTTVYIPLRDFVENKATGSTTMHLTNADLVNFCALLFGDADDANVGLPINIGIDNLRIVKIK